MAMQRLMLGILTLSCAMGPLSVSATPASDEHAHATECTQKSQTPAVQEEEQSCATDQCIEDLHGNEGPERAALAAALSVPPFHADADHPEPSGDEEPAPRGPSADPFFIATIVLRC